MSNLAVQSAPPEPQIPASGLRAALFSGNYNYTRDGANKALNKLVNHLLERGASVRVYSPTGSPPAFEPAGELVSVPSIPFPGRPEFRVALGLPAYIERDVRKFRPNIVHVSAPDWLGFGAQRLARALRVPIVASMHTRFETYFEYYGLRMLRSWAIKRQRAFYQASDLVLVPNEHCKRQLRQMGVAPEVMRNWSRGTEHDIFAPGRRDFLWRRAHGFRDDDPVLLFFGRLVREKGVASFVETVAELRRRGVEVNPLIVGNGPARAEMNKLGGAIFTGELHGEALGRAVASADILLNPSTTEAFGNVNLEAMAAGLAVVSADAGSAVALIKNGVDGFLCPPEPGPFADAVQELWKNPALRAAIGANAARTAQGYRWPAVLDDVLRAYRELSP